MRIVLDLAARAADDPHAACSVLRVLLHAMTVISVPQFVQLGLPRLYESRIRYRREPRGPGWVREQWQDAARTAAIGSGDCEDLATYLAAQYQAEGFDAWPDVLAFPPRVGRPGWLFHIVVRRPDGVREDPSRLLGMGLPDPD